jgi:hypothetical protein
MGNDDIFFFTIESIIALGTPAFLSYGCQALSSQGKSGWGVKLANLFHLVPRLKMHGAIPPLLH